jgi:divalent metal cation (Fe/Co/Zn/Cd) transporter
MDVLISLVIVVSMIICCFGSNVSWVSSIGGLAISSLLLQSAVFDVVTACQALHSYLSKRIEDS